MKKVRWAIMGMGLQGRRLLKAIQKSNHAKLVVTAGERESGSFAKALKNASVDAVAIATPNDNHASQIIAAAKARKHILCEKPLVLSMREARSVERAVKRARIRCFVNYHLRMHPEAARVRALILQKKLGRITSIDMQWSIGGLANNTPELPHHMQWREDPKRSGGGALMARGVHLFDLLRFLTGEEICVVKGSSDATKNTVDRTVVATCILSSGAIAKLTTSKVMPHADNHIEIRGTKSTIVLRAVFTDDPGRMYVRVFDSFADVLRGKKTLLATLQDGIATVAITDAFIRSVREKKAVRLVTRAPSATQYFFASHS